MKTANEILHKVQLELKTPKSLKNQFGGYKYRNVEQILEQIKKILPPGTSITLSDDISNIEDRFYIKSTATLHTPHGDITTTAFAREDFSKKGMDVAQLTGACSSYARKYALCGLFAIDSSEDLDDMDNRGIQKAKEDAKYTYKFDMSHDKIEAIVQFAEENRFDMSDTTEHLFVTTDKRIKQWDKFRNR